MTRDPTAFGRSAAGTPPLPFPKLGRFLPALVALALAACCPPGVADGAGAETSFTSTVVRVEGNVWQVRLADAPGTTRVTLPGNALVRDAQGAALEAAAVTTGERVWIRGTRGPGDVTAHEVRVLARAP